ncbi:MAG: NAD-dependent epimerase/dehydratase family protein [Haloarculaceae archaeon]
MADTHVAVTGAAGYIGSRVVGDLGRDHPDWEITALDNFYRGDVREIAGVPVEHVDIRNRGDLEEALAGADVVVHLAAISGVDDCDDNPDLAHEVNVRATADVARFCHRTGAGLLFPFSVAVLGDPESFPISVDDPRDPLNWYGRTKVLGEATIDAFADGAFPAHQHMIANLYGGHEVDGRTVSKRVVIDFFVERALAGDTLTVYEPGSQSRNFVHVKDVAAALVRSTERLRRQVAGGTTGVEKFEIASEQDFSVREVGEMVADAADDHGIDVDVALVENPRSGETLIEDFDVAVDRTREVLDWEPTREVEASIRTMLDRRAE